MFKPKHGFIYSIFPFLRDIFSSKYYGENKINSEANKSMPLSTKDTGDGSVDEKDLKKFIIEQEEEVRTKDTGDGSVDEKDLKKFIMEQEKEICKILSLDGGGIRGAMTTGFLMKLDDLLKTQKKVGIYEYFDCFSGTSTGGIIALMLANKVPIKEIDKIYSQKVAKKMFKPKRGFIYSIFPFLRGIFSSKYYGENKRNTLKNQLDQYTVTGDDSDCKLSELQLCKSLKPVMVTAFDLNSSKTKVLSSFGKGRDIISNISVLDAMDATTAAVTLFPAVNYQQNEKTLKLTDGGPVANNSAEVVRVTAKCIERIGRNPKILSVGTAVDKDTFTTSNDSGILGWLKNQHLSKLMMSSSNEYSAQKALGDHYLRINTPSQESFKNKKGERPQFKLDDISLKNITNLKEEGKRRFTELKANENFKKFIKFKLDDDTIDGDIEKNTIIKRPSSNLENTTINAPPQSISDVKQLITDNIYSNQLIP